MSRSQEVRLPDRLGGLRRFAVAITVLNVLGHTVLGFEQSVLHPIVGLAAAYGTELLLEWVDARLNRRPPRFRGGVRPLVESLLSAHITGLAVAMLMYTNARLMPVAFAASAAIASKAVFRVSTPAGRVHFFNPSNFGIALTLLLFPWIGQVQPYHFTENLTGLGDAALPAVIVASGSFLNTRFTHRVPLIAAWLGAFALQAVGRTLVHGTPIVAALLPMTGVAFILFSFYMITDPATTPNGTRGQVAFGVGTAAAYCLFISAHIVFGLFFGLAIVCAVRGALLHARALAARRAAATRSGAPVAVPVGARTPAAVTARRPVPAPAASLAPVDGHAAPQYGAQP